jgi:hypothetical protein
MALRPVGPFVIDNEIDADEYLTALFEKPDYRSTDEVHMRAEKYIKNDDHLKNYFINKTKELLNS